MSSTPYVYVYQPYPRRLYMGGVVLENDPHATNSVVVEDEAGEAAARAKGYRKAHEKAADLIEKQESTDGNGGSSAADFVVPHQGDVAVASVDPDDIESLRAQAKALGLNVHHKAGAAKLREAIAKAASL